MQTVIKVKKPAGHEVLIQTKIPVPQAMLAQQIVNSLVATEHLRLAMTDEDQKPKISPRHIASLACDIASAMYDEFEKREWLIEVNPPNESV